MFNPKVVDNYDYVDQMNVEWFNEFGIEFPDVQRHTCVVCGDKTCISDSRSNAGHNLVCRSCYSGHTYEEIIEWIDADANKPVDDVV